MADNDENNTLASELIRAAVGENPAAVQSAFDIMVTNNLEQLVADRKLGVAAEVFGSGVVPGPEDVDADNFGAKVNRRGGAGQRSVWQGL